MNRRLLAVVAAATFSTTLVTVLPSAKAAPSGRSTLTGSAPKWSHTAPQVGTTAPATLVGFRVYLGWQGGDAAANLAQAVSDPRSSTYRQYLSAAEFRRRIAPTQAQVGAVQAWLRASGFTLDYTPSNNHYVAAHGSAAQV